MSLRIRRGTDAQRQQITPDEGEIIFTTNTQKMYIGDGITQGGINIGQTLAGTGLVFDAISQTLQATGSGSGGSGLTSVSADLNPALGGNLNLNSHNITGTGNISTSGTLSVNGLGADLVLNSHNITGTGNISTSGTLSVNGLGADLVLNNYSITGTGNINTNGTLSVNGLGKNLVLSGYNITGTGNVNITGAMSATTISAGTGLGADLSLNGHNINGTGNITTNGNITATNIGNGSLTINNNTINTGTYSCNVTSSNPTTFNVVGLTDGSISGSSAIDINSSRGTIASPTTVQAGDYVSRITMAGWTGSGYTPAGSIYANFQAGAVLADVTPASQLTFVVGANGTNVQTAIFNSKGVFAAPVLSTGSYAGSGAYPTFPQPTLAAGSIIFDSTTKHFMGYDGTGWKQLDN